MDVAAIVLTGGTSRRMGRTKATLPAGATTLARRTATLVLGVAEPAVEVGPGYSGLPAVADSIPRGGPLAAMATGAAWLAGHGWSGPALVVATDLPVLNAEMLRWLAAHPAEGSVVPLDVEGRPQPLCARYHPEELTAAELLVAAGQRAMGALLERAPSITWAPAAEWGSVAGAHALVDVDTPADLAVVIGLAGDAGAGGRR